MGHWITTSLFALISFGIWGLFSKLTMMHVNSKAALVYQTLGVLLIGIVTYGLVGFKPQFNVHGFGFGIATGIAYALGCLLYFIAVNQGGSLVAIVTMTAMYPMITILLSYFILNEALSIKQILGIGFATVAMVLFSF
jgi:transporter family protein